MVEQNLLFAVSLATLGGLIQVLSVLIIAWPEHVQQTNPKKASRQFSPLFLKLLVPFNIFIQLFNGAANTGAAIYGPVAIVMPVMVSSQLLFNIIIFGYLEMEFFGKDVQVGTFIVVLGAVVLPTVGPTVQQNQNILELLSAPPSLVWTSFLFVGVVVSGVLCYCCVAGGGPKSENHETRIKERWTWKAESLLTYIVLVTARVFSSVLSTSLSKTFALVSGGYTLIASIVGFLICGVVLSTSVVLQATKTEQKLFVPIISCATQLVNAATGLILWEDWRVVQSWVGYSAVLVQIVVGVYLISSLDFFENTAEPNFGMRQTLVIRNIHTHGENSSFRTLRSIGRGGNNNSDNDVNNQYDTPDTESAGGSEVERRRQAWESLRRRIADSDANGNGNGNADEERFFVDGIGLGGSGSFSVGSPRSLRSLKSHNTVRGLIGGISRDPSYMSYKRPGTMGSKNMNNNMMKMDILTEAFDHKCSKKERYMLKSLEMAEEAARQGRDHFVYEIDSSAVMDSVGSLTADDEDDGEDGGDKKYYGP